MAESPTIREMVKVTRAAGVVESLIDMYNPKNLKCWIRGKCSEADMREAGMFKTGDKVRKIGGDYRFEGTVVSVFTKLSGARRVVVEDDRGVLFIFNETQLEGGK